MGLPHRYITLLTIAVICFFLFLFRGSSISQTWRTFPQSVGLGETLDDDWLRASTSHGNDGFSADGKDTDNDPTAPIDSPPASWKAEFKPGVSKPAGENYTRLVVITRTLSEDVSWLKEDLPDVETAIYVADDPQAPLHPPKNKGHEVMVYLTYIIDNYENLPDVTLFMHSHKLTWHNNELLGNDAVEIIRRLNLARVVREGYMNLRCHWDPGCPDWMHPGSVEENIYKQEETMIAKAWAELFPLEPIPGVLAQPCCSQFALSRERIRAIPLSRYVYYRDWLLRTQLSDYISGRIWEYTWQFVFTGEAVHCPAMHACYCDGYGLCFGGPAEFESWFEARWRMREKERELTDWEDKDKAIKDLIEEGKASEAAELEVPEPGKDKRLREQIAEMDRKLEERRLEALRRGENPRLRAEDVGREWKEGDGF